MNEVHVFPLPQKNSLHKPIDLWGRLPNRLASSPRLRVIQIAFTAYSTCATTSSYPDTTQGVLKSLSPSCPDATPSRTL